ncbi:hypothetical protein MLD38_023000 [Melastoma candidum]|uniref:Uncharacterized protein n=1 Tax=Melastoma candidum TaxID=119954 RepID=A0ACB9QU99_9MYRT|nr:hypothetical protein MLD38_023000 [Melastoma candidum]
MLVEMDPILYQKCISKHDLQRSSAIEEAEKRKKSLCAATPDRNPWPIVEPRWFVIIMVATLANSSARIPGLSLSSGLIQPGCSSTCSGIKLHRRSFASIGRDSSLFSYTRVPCLSIRCSVDRNGRGKYAVSAMRNYAESNSGNSLSPESFWHSLYDDVIRSLKSLIIFLWEQPGQLKHIEWPSFQSTLKTATLTLVLMAVFIVALSAVDAVLRFLLGFALRKKV